MSKIDILQIIEKEIAPIYQENYRQMKECFRKTGIVDDVFGEIRKYILPKNFIEYGYNKAMEYWFCYYPYNLKDCIDSIMYFDAYEYKVEVLLPVKKVLEIIIALRNLGITYKPQCISKKFYIYNNYVIIDNENEAGLPAGGGCLLTMKNDMDLFNYKEKILKDDIKKIDIYLKDEFDPVEFILNNKMKDLDKIKEILKFFSGDNYERDVLRVIGN
jgi:hypothetical protein